jgi:hypothetical protein
MYSGREVETEFAYHIEKENVKFVWKNVWNLPAKTTSDIFEFVWDSLEVEYLRKN